jgi:lipopolysaccharide export system protein LptA
MAWQRQARIVVAAVGIATVAAVYLTLGERRRATTRITGSQLAAKVVAESTNADLENFKGLDSKYRVHAARLTSYEDGSSRGSDVKIETADREGRAFVVTARQSFVTKGNADIQLTQSVNLRENDGFGLQTEEAVFNQSSGMARADGAVAFGKGRMTGSGVGVTYDEHADVLVVRDRAVIDLAAMGDQPATSFKGSTATLDRVAHLLTVGGDVRVTHGEQIITTSRAVAHLTDGDDHIKFVELRDGSRVEGGLGNVAAMTAQDMDLDYAEDGQTIQHATLRGGGSITMTAAAGKSGRRMDGDTLEIALRADQTLDRLTGNGGVAMTIPAVDGAPQRTVRGQTVDAKSGPDGALTAAHFAGDVEFTEASGEGGMRKATSRILDLEMRDDAVSQAVFTDGARFSDGDLTATAREAQYDPDGGRLRLRKTDERGNPPSVADARVSIEGASVDIELDARKISAKGHIRSTLNATSGSGRGGKDTDADTRLPGLLQQDTPAQLTAEEVEYVGETGLALYSGEASLAQGETIIRAATIELQEKLGDLTARGGVTSKIVMGSDVSSGVASELHYVDKDRTITYLSPRAAAGADPVPPAHVQGAQGDLRARVVQIFLESQASTLQRLRADDDVVSTVDKRIVRGRRLTYTAKDESYAVEGSSSRPVVLQQAVQGGCQELKGLNLTFFKSTDTMNIDGRAVSWTLSRKLPSCQ